MDVSGYLDREARVLELLERFGFLTSEQVRAFLFDGTPTTRSSQRVLTNKVLRSLLQARSIKRVTRLVGSEKAGTGGYVYFLGGKREPRGLAGVRHALFVADVGLGFENAARRRHEQLLTFETGWTADGMTADAFLIYKAKLELFALLELETGTQGTRMFQRKIDRYISLHYSETWKRYLELWPTVLTVTMDEQHRSLLKRATAAMKVPASMEFCFATLQDVKRDPMASIWHIVGKDGAHALFEEATK